MRESWSYIDITRSAADWVVIRLGHSGEVFATRFDPTGQHIASGSMDRSISMSLFYVEIFGCGVFSCDAGLTF